MPLQIMLPNGTPTLLESLSDHDLRQYYMHQMDMLTQAEDVLERLGISGWLNGTQNPSEKGVVVERYSSPASEFMAPPSAGNHLPTHYDAARWNGLVNDSGRILNPPVAAITAEQLRVDITRQHALLESFQQATVAMVNFAKNIADATQPPMPELDPD